MSQKHPRGLTVVETLVAATVVLVALVAISSMFPTAAFNVDQGGRLSRAAALAQGAVEAVRNGPFPAAGTGACSGGGTVPQGYTCNQTVTITGAAPNQMAIVTVAVTWTQAQRGGTVTMMTQVSQP